jgi:hypothetical protein
MLLSLKGGMVRDRPLFEATSEPKTGRVPKKRASLCCSDRPVFQHHFILEPLSQQYWNCDVAVLVVATIHLFTGREGWSPAASA